MDLAVKLFLAFLQIGAFSIGGGYAVIGLIQEQVVRKYGWLTEQTFTDIVTISQMTPGPLAVNASTFAGFRTDGIAGAAAATVGCVAGGILFSLLLYRFFQKNRSSYYMSELLKGLKAASCGLILSAAGTIILLTFFGSSQPDTVTLTDADWRSISLFLAALLLPKIIMPLFPKTRGKKLGPIALMLLTGAAGYFLYS